MTPCTAHLEDVEPTTDAELMDRLNKLYAAGDYSGGARDDFWDLVSHHIGWIMDIANRGAKLRKRSPEKHRAAGLARAASLTPERRTEIAKQAAQARWGGHENSSLGKVTPETKP